MKAREPIDDRNKQLTPLNRNYFFAVTVLIVIANIIIQATRDTPTVEALAATTILRSARSYPQKETYERMLLV